MARKARFNIAGVPQHIVQRSNNREPCFSRRMTIPGTSMTYTKPPAGIGWRYMLTC